MDNPPPLPAGVYWCFQGTAKAWYYRVHTGEPSKFFYKTEEAAEAAFAEYLERIKP
jgi:hypothetical protein